MLVVGKDTGMLLAVPFEGCMEGVMYVFVVELDIDCDHELVDRCYRLYRCYRTVRGGLILESAFGERNEFVGFPVVGIEVVVVAASVGALTILVARNDELAAMTILPICPGFPTEDVLDELFDEVTDIVHIEGTFVGVGGIFGLGRVVGDDKVLVPTMIVLYIEDVDGVGLLGEGVEESEFH